MKVSGGIVCSGVIDGTDGYSSAVVQLFRRSATALGNGDRPTGTLTYTFATGVLSGTASYFNGWSQSMPQASEGTKLYVTMATARSQGATDTIAASEWSTPAEYVADGMKYASVIIYKRSASQPTDKPANGAVYTFATGGLTGTLNGWSTAIPATNANHDPCWVRHATAVSSGTTDTIAASEWSDPAVKLVEDGAGGAVATVTPGELSVQCDKDGKVATAISGQPLSFVLTVGGVECTNVKATRQTSGVTPPLPALPNGVSVSSSGGTIVSISVAKQYAPAAGQTAPVTDTMLAAGATFLVKGTDAAGNEVTSRCTLGLKGLRQGEQGGDGPATPVYDIIFDSYSVIYDAQTGMLDAVGSMRVRKAEGSTSDDNYYDGIAMQYRLYDNVNWDTITYSGGKYSFTIQPLTSVTQPKTFNFRVVDSSSNAVLCTASMPVTVKGDKGETGRMFYMMGDWSASTKYERSEEVVPMVFYNDGEWNDYLEVKGGYYYLIQSSAEGENQKPGNTTYWKRCDDYGVILTQGIFADFAKLGSAIFCGDWMFSQHGKIGDTIISSSNPDYSGKKGYLYFDAGAPTGNRTLGVSGSVSSTSATRVGGFFELSSGCKIIKVNARVNGSGQTMIVAVRKVTKASNLGDVNVTSTTNSDYYIIIKDIDNASDYYVAANMTGSGGGSIRGAELVAFVPNYAVDLLTGKAYMNDAVVRGAVYADRGEFKGSVTVSNSDTQSVTITPSGITARWDNDGFRLTADGLERYDSRSGTWGPMFAGRRVDMVNYYSSSTAKSLTSTHDFVIADPSSGNFNIYLPTSPANGKIITIQCVSQNRSVIVNAVGGSRIITAGDQGSYPNVSVNNYERAEFVAYGNNWYVTRSAWDYGD